MPSGASPTALAALDGARWILLERLSDDPHLLESLRQYVLAHALLQAKVVEGRQEKGEKFAEYFAFSEPARSLPSHRVLALFRGRKEGVLRLVLPAAASAGWRDRASGAASKHPAGRRAGSRFRGRRRRRDVGRGAGARAARACPSR